MTKQVRPAGVSRASWRYSNLRELEAWLEEEWTYNEEHLNLAVTAASVAACPRGEWAIHGFDAPTAEAREHWQTAEPLIPRMDDGIQVLVDAITATF